MRLLAKSPPDRLTADKDIPESATLFGHVKQCIDVANILTEHTAEAMVWACGIKDDRQVEWFRRALRWCTTAHDLGKATKKFQSVLRNPHEPPHWVRHEVVSYWMLTRHAGLAEAMEESFADHGRYLLENPRYARALEARGDPREFARRIASAGYATDPAYASKLISLMERYGLFHYDC
ncbi:MAG: hypothetical protein K6T31_09865 [Alicyclobacillus sp.]|nr:hypothetical protein [Alicyclobacillus sp.]